jgi:hypothetical protein
LRDDLDVTDPEDEAKERAKEQWSFDPEFTRW